MNFKEYKEKLRGLRKEAISDAGMDPKCPKCGAPMYWRSATSLSGGSWGLYPEGAWECSNTRCWNMLPPGELAPDTGPENPDTGHSDLTLPEGWQ